MTVAELIEELQKHPGHHTVMLVTPAFNYEGEDMEDYHSAASVEYESGVIGSGCTVNIMGES